MTAMVVALRDVGEYNLRHGMCCETCHLQTENSHNRTQKEIAMAQDLLENCGPNGRIC